MVQVRPKVVRSVYRVYFHRKPLVVTNVNRSIAFSVITTRRASELVGTPTSAHSVCVSPSRSSAFCIHFVTIHMLDGLDGPRPTATADDRPRRCRDMDALNTRRMGDASARRQLKDMLVGGKVSTDGTLSMKPIQPVVDGLSPTRSLNNTGDTGVTTRAKQSAAQAYDYIEQKQSYGDCQSVL